MVEVGPIASQGAVVYASTKRLEGPACTPALRLLRGLSGAKVVLHAIADLAVLSVRSPIHLIHIGAYRDRP